MVQPKRKKTRTKEAKAEPSPLIPDAIQGEVSIDPTRDQPPFNSTHQIFNEVEDYAIILLNDKGEITSWNKGAEKIKGYVSDEIIGKNYRIFYTQEDKDNNLSEKLLEEARKKGRTNYEGWRVSKNGTRFWGNMTLTALHDETGEVLAFVKLTRDLTEKKIAEDAYSNLVEKLRLKNAELKESEERYHKMIMEVRDYAIILLDPDGKILDWNKGAEKVKGYTAKEIIGKNFRLFYTKEDKDSRLPETLLASAARNGSVIHEGWRIRKDGRRFWGNVTITALHSDSGAIIGFSKVTRDLTDKKIAEDKMGNLLEELRQANEQLRRSEDRYQKMISEVQDYAILFLDTGGKIENWNSGAEIIKGYSAKEIIGRNFRVFYTKEDQLKGLPEKLIGEARKKGRVTHEGWRVRKDGTRFWGSVVITALHNVQGEVIGYSKVTRDLTERKIAEDSLKANAAQLDLKNKSLERLNEELASFSHIASHDLKEPLRKIETFANRVKDVKDDPQKVDEYTDKVIESAWRMRSLIQDLLNYSQVTNDSSATELVDLNKTLDEIKADLEVQIGEKSATIRSNRLPLVRAVPHQMHQLFLNLISNALKFSRPGVSPSINIHCRKIKGPDIPGELPNGDNRYFHISVQDNGIGFEMEKVDRIFDPFYRLHPRDRYSGTGLGLAIVKKIVQGHGGIVITESAIGVGSTFHLYLPAKAHG